MRHLILCAALCCLGVFVLAGCKKNCEPGAAQRCFCPEGTVAQQTCREDGAGWEACDCTYYTAWCDDTSGLCWQDPQREADDLDEGGLRPADAVRYCEQVAFGGYSDWRLPTIDELRTLVRGNPATEAGGECPLHDGSVSSDMNDPTCQPAAEYGGPGDGGCYWPAELTGNCKKPDPESQGHPLEYVSSTRCPDDPTRGWYGTVMFENGAVCWNHIDTWADVRCVRAAPTPRKTCTETDQCMPGATRRCIADNGRAGAQVCASWGCWEPCESTAFTKTPTSPDVCPTCDQIKLTVRVPEKLAAPPAQLMAFLYDAGTWTFPPNRPPDGGNSACQVKNPDIDVDQPYVMTVPACTYYRKQCLSGSYKLYVAILQSEVMPPVMQEGDYWWGADAEQPEALVLGDGPQQEITMDITLVPWAP